MVSCYGFLVLALCEALRGSWKVDVDVHLRALSDSICQPCRRTWAGIRLTRTQISTGVHRDPAPRECDWEQRQNKGHRIKMK